MALEATNNSIFNSFLRGSNEYQQFEGRVDSPDALAQEISDPRYPASKIWNEFQEYLIVGLGSQRVKALNWENPLAEFKTEDFANGQNFSEYGFPYIEALQYDPHANNFLKRHNIDVKSAFYGVNRRVVYPFTVNTSQLQRSFKQEGGVVEFINGVVNAAMVSNSYDEYRFMLETFAQANQRNPFYNVQVGIENDREPTEAELKNLSVKLRTVGMEFKTAPTGRYNAYGLPSVSQSEDLVLITTPAIRAALDVNVLADAFNVDRADFVNRVIVVDEMPWAGAHAILVDKKAIIAGNSILEIRDFSNPMSLETNYYLHSQGGYSISPMHNIAVLSNTPSTQIDIVDFTVTGLDAKLGLVSGKDFVEVSTVVPGTQNTKLSVEVFGEVEGDERNQFVVPGSYTTKVKTSGEIDSGIYVSSTGHVHVPWDIETGTEVEIEVTTAYRNPSLEIGQETETFSETISFTVSKTVEEVQEDPQG